MKHDAIVDAGIPIHERIPIPDDMIPADSRVEIDAKIQAGYFTTGTVMSMEELANVKGRGWDDVDVCIPRTLERLTELTAFVALSRPCDLVSMQGRKAASSDCSASRLSPATLPGGMQWTRTQCSHTTVVEGSHPNQSPGTTQCL